MIKPKWNAAEGALKRLADIMFCTLALLALSPFLLILILFVLTQSGFPVFYSQERIGKNKKPFQIYKFRTMNVNAEEEGPLLAKENDDRITPIGNVLRKWRLDELPQLWNVIKGDMSIVGPRPERAFYVEQLEQKVEDYSTLFQVRPGITSSGMVHFGYASTVEEMVERAQFDLEYLQQLSLGKDIGILVKTIAVVIDGRGK